MNIFIKKTFVVCLSFLLLLLSLTFNVSADEPMVTYGVEYGDNSATITIYLDVIDAFDIAVAYDANKLTVSKSGYSMEFKKLQVGGENTTISVSNPDAKDKAGNTYMIFTGAGANMETSEGIEFAGKPLCYVTFEGDLSGSEITILTDSAAVDNVYDANFVGKITCDAENKTEVTPKPVEGVVYEKIEENISKNDKTTSESVEIPETSNESSEDKTVVSDNKTEEIAPTEDNVEIESTDNNDSIENSVESKEKLNEVDKDSPIPVNGKNNAFIITVSAILVVGIIVAIILVFKKKK